MRTLTPAMLSLGAVSSSNACVSFLIVILIVAMAITSPSLFGVCMRSIALLAGAAAAAASSVARVKMTRMRELKELCVSFFQFDFSKP